MNTDSCFYFFSGWASPFGEFRPAGWGHHALVAREILEGKDSSAGTLACQMALLQKGWIRLAVLPIGEPEIFIEGAVSDHHFKAILARAREYDERKGAGASDSVIQAIETSIAERRGVL